MSDWLTTTQSKTQAVPSQVSLGGSQPSTTPPINNDWLNRVKVNPQPTISKPVETPAPPVKVSSTPSIFSKIVEGVKTVGSAIGNTLTKVGNATNPLLQIAKVGSSIANNPIAQQSDVVSLGNTFGKSLAAPYVTNLLNNGEKQFSETSRAITNKLNDPKVAPEEKIKLKFNLDKLIETRQKEIDNITNEYSTTPIQIMKSAIGTFGTITNPALTVGSGALSAIFNVISNVNNGKPVSSNMQEAVIQGFNFGGELGGVESIFGIVPGADKVLGLGGKATQAGLNKVLPTTIQFLGKEVTGLGVSAVIADVVNSLVRTIVTGAGYGLASGQNPITTAKEFAPYGFVGPIGKYIINPTASQIIRQFGTTGYDFLANKDFVAKVTRGTEQLTKEEYQAWNILNNTGKLAEATRGEVTVPLRVPKIGAFWDLLREKFPDSFDGLGNPKNPADLAKKVEQLPSLAESVNKEAIIKEIESIQKGESKITTAPPPTTLPAIVEQAKPANTNLSVAQPSQVVTPPIAPSVAKPADVALTATSPATSTQIAADTPSKKPPYSSKEARAVQESFKGETVVPEKQAPLGEGKLVKSKLIKRLEEQLLDSEGNQYDFDPYTGEHNKLSLNTNSTKTIDFIETNPEKALRIAYGLEPNDAGVTTFAIKAGLALKAKQEGNIKLWKELIVDAANGLTRAGQEIVSARGHFNNDAPENFIKRVLSERLTRLGENFITKARQTMNEGFAKANEKTSPKKAATDRIDKEAAKLADKMKAEQSRIKSAQDILDLLTCKV